MISKVSPICINPGKPFESCQLNRQPYAQILTNLVQSVPNGMVLAINNDWGAGKTTFIRMWRAYLENLQFRTVYFNAWENDLDKNAMAAILGEISELVDGNTQKTFEDLLERSALIASKAIPALLQGLIKQRFGSDIGEVAKAASEGVVATLKKDVEEYKKKKEGVIAFKEKLDEFVSLTSSSKPLIFFVDELDRCRPDYAVEVLEQIKHFFSIEGIVFVLSLDKTQLAHAIQGYYGSAEFNSLEYLRRFIDVEYSLPNPDIRSFCEFLIDSLEFNVFFNTSIRLNNRRDSIKTDLNDFLELSVLLLAKANPPLRTIEKVMMHARVALLTFSLRANVYPDLLVVLIYLKLERPDVWTKLRSKDFKASEVLKLLDGMFNYSRDESRKINRVHFMQAMFLTLFNNFTGELEGDRIVEMTDPSSKLPELLRSTLPSSSPGQFHGYMKQMNNNPDYFRTGLDHLITHIELIESDSHV